MKDKFRDAYDKSKIRNRLRTLKIHYNHIKILVGLNGFGWEDVIKRVTASEEVWDGFVEASALVIIYSSVILLIIFLISSLSYFVSYVNFKCTRTMNFIDKEIIPTFKSLVLYKRINRGWKRWVIDQSKPSPPTSECLSMLINNADDRLEWLLDKLDDSI